MNIYLTDKIDIIPRFDNVYIKTKEGLLVVTRFLYNQYVAATANITSEEYIKEFYLSKDKKKIEVYNRIQDEIQDPMLRSLSCLTAFINRDLSDLTTEVLINVLIDFTVDFDIYKLFANNNNPCINQLEISDLFIKSTEFKMKSVTNEFVKENNEVIEMLKSKLIESLPKVELTTNKVTTTSKVPSETVKKEESKSVKSGSLIGKDGEIDEDAFMSNFKIPDFSAEPVEKVASRSTKSTKSVKEDKGMSEKSKGKVSKLLSKFGKAGD